MVSLKRQVKKKDWLEEAVRLITPSFAADDPTTRSLSEQCGISQDEAIEEVMIRPRPDAASTMQQQAEAEARWAEDMLQLAREQLLNDPEMMKMWVKKSP
ncbi:unnamed protein product [Amoebophrya sp. A25]|nr:unnamed protein product [Amoebophrya sp. A25]|eukprot:GSA25T00019463001.1